MNNSEITNNILDNTIDIATDVAEVAIDNFLQDGSIIKDIPIAGSIYSTFKIGKSIRDAVFVKNIVTFLQECKRNDNNYEKRRKIKDKFIKDENYRIKVTETTIVFIGKVENAHKAKKLAKLFIALCNDDISFDEYELFSKIIENIAYFDYRNITKLLAGPIIPTNENNEYVTLGTITRLKNYGLVDSDQRKGNNIKSERDSEYRLTENGEKFARIIMN